MKAFLFPDPGAKRWWSASKGMLSRKEQRLHGLGTESKNRSLENPITPHHSLFLE